MQAGPAAVPLRSDLAAAPNQPANRRARLMVGSAARRWAGGTRLQQVWRTTASYLLLALLTLPVGANLLRQGFWASGDGLHHLHRVAALTRYLQEGVLYPRWIGEFAFGYGVPLFNFYSPLSYYLAQPAALLGPLWALKLAMLAGLFASGVALYRFTAAHLGREAALMAALIYLYAPYRLVDLYPRAAFAEHMAFLWLPIILWAYDGLWAGRRQVWQALSWAGLLLTHSFTALMFAPFFALYLAGRAWATRQWRLLWRGLPPLGLAIGLTAFFWLPLAAEARYAGLGAGSGDGYRHHLVAPLQLVGPLLYDYATGSDRPDTYFAFGLIPTLILAVGAASELWSRRFLPLYGSVACLAAFFLASQPSQPIWDAAAPVLAALQFPWRFLAISALGLALSAAGLIHAITRGRGAAAASDISRRERGRLWLARPLIALIAGALLVSGLARLPFEQTAITTRDIEPEGLWQLDRATGQTGTTWVGELLPIWVAEQRWALGRPPEAPVDGPAIAAATVRLLRRSGDDLLLWVENSVTWPLRLHAFYSPGWQARVDGVRVPTGATGDMGLVTAEMPVGAHVVSIRYEATTVRLAARWLSIVAWAGLLFAAWRRQRSKRPLTSILLAAAVFLAAILPHVTLWSVQPPPVVARFGDQAQLVGVETSLTGRPGARLPVRLYWLALRSTARNDKTFVHLVNAAGQLVAQHDGDPGGGFTPTTRWQPGELIPDRHYLDLPPDLPAGRYRLKTGMYQLEPFRNLLTDPASVDGRIDLGEVVIK